MTTKNKTLSFQTKKEFDFIDITKEVIAFVSESGIKNGLINIQTKHTTTAVFVNENETGLRRDIIENLKRIAPPDIYYEHDDFEKRTENMCVDECANGRSHCKALYLPTSVSLNIVDGKIQLGTWQRVFLFELDRPRLRNISILIMGE